MRQLLASVIIVLLTVLVNCQQDHRPATKNNAPEAQVVSAFSQHSTHHQEAVLSDASSLYRICSSRPQRIVPSHGSKSERSVNPWNLERKYHVKPLYSIFDNRRRHETAPFCLSVSCHYYVIALRHIIR